MRTLLDGDSQIADSTIAKKDMVSNFLAAQDWDLTNGAKDATFIHLKDAVLDHSPATMGQLNAVEAALTAQFGSGLDYKGLLDASDDTAFIAASHSKGDFYKVSVAGTISGEVVNVGDMVIINKVVAGGALVAADVDVIDNTESADILRIVDLIDNLTSNASDKPLTANQGYLLKGMIDLLSSRVKAEKIGEKPAPTQSLPTLPPLANLPIAGTVRVYRNSGRMDEGSGEDYTVNYATGVITFEFNLKSADKILVDYKYEY